MNFEEILLRYILPLLFVGLGLPLYYEKIKPNMIYGFRITLFVLQNKEAWYAVNKQGGKDFIIIGLLALILGSTMQTFEEAAMYVSIMIAIGSIISIVRAYVLAFGMKKKITQTEAAQGNDQNQ